MEDFDLEIQKNNESESTLNYPLIIGLIVALLLIGGGIYWYMTRDTDDTDESQEEMVSGEETTTIQTDDEATEKVIDSTEFNQNAGEQSAPSEETEPQTTDTNTETENTTATESSTGQTSDSSSSGYDHSENVYFIVSGAFRSEENAQNKVAKLKADGYNAIIVGQNGAGLFIVAYEGFSNIDEAKTKLAEIKQSHPQAWIYKKQN